MSAIVLDSSKLLSAIRDSIACQLRAKAQCELPAKVLLDVARNVAMAVMALDLDDTHVIDAPEIIDTRSLLSARERHHDRCMTPGDDGHLTCPVVAGREAL